MNIGTRQLPGEPAIAGVVLLIAALFLLASFAALTTTEVAAQTSPERESTERQIGDLEGAGDVSYEDDEIEVVELINDYRVENGLEPVMVSDTASLTAKRHSEDMGVYDFFDHTTMDSSYFPSGASFSDRMDASGYDHNTNRSENIAAGGSDPDTTMQQWINSPDHNANMLREDWQVVGISHAEVPGSTYTDYWTTNFGAHVDESATEVSEISDSGDGSEGASEEESSEAGESRDGDSGYKSREDRRDDSESEPEEDGSSDRNSSDRSGDAGEGDGDGENSSNTTVLEETNEGASGNEGTPGEDDSSSTDTEGNDGESDGESSERESDRERDSGSSGESSSKGRDADSGGSAGGSSDECDTMAGFQKNPIDDDDFGEDLRKRIQAKVDCKMNSSSIEQDADDTEDEE